ncbi:hypothetical protein [Diaphorobacter sp. HDW4A]|nr:hypothetical protein [Diaphorobacter sp. HDW4A]
MDEIGRRLATEVAYVVPATEIDGDIELPGKIFYKRVAEPSQFLFVRATFGFDDAVGESVREMGVFFGTQIAAGVPAGQRYLSPDQIADAGEIWSMEFRARMVRDGGTKGNEEIVIPL